MEDKKSPFNKEYDSPDIHERFSGIKSLNIIKEIFIYYNKLLYNNVTIKAC